MKRFRVIGLDRERLLATELSVEILFGSQMAEASLTKRFSCIGADAVRASLGFSGGDPALPAVHEDISRWPRLRDLYAILGLTVKAE
jgi:hypothetical protein